MEIFFGIITALSLIVCIVLVIDATIFRYTIREVRVGMTGQEVQETLGKKITIVKVSGKNSYMAIATSKTTIFKCRFVFVDGKLMSKSK